MSNKTRSSPCAVVCSITIVLAGTALLVDTPPIGAAQRFRRADSNADGALDIGDAVFTLGFLFRGTPDRIPCDDAADSNDDGKLDISDPVHSLGYLFLGSPGPPPPFGSTVSGCGDDPTSDALGCGSFPPCPTPTLPPGAPVLVAPTSPTRDGAVGLRGTSAAGLRVRITGGSDPFPIETLAGPEGVFTATVGLSPNRLNRLFAVVADADGRSSAPAAVEVIQDSLPPFVYIDEPADGATVLTALIAVTGRVADMLSGFQGLAVTVNAAPAAVAIGIGTNGTFERQGVPLALGENTITVEAVDAVGNSASHAIRITRADPPPTADRIELVSGNRQAKAPIHATLPEPIVVRARKADGSPIAGKLVTFRVLRRDGRLATKPGTVPDDRVMTLAVLTDAEGLAAAHWTLGGDAGCGNNRVRATGKDLAGEVLFCASAAPGPAAQINIGSGNNQRGEAGAPAPEALRAWVSDGCNGIEGVLVTFTVTRGSGKVDGAASVTVPTGPTGHAQVSFVFGPEAGNQILQADFAGNAGAPAFFTAHALLRYESQPTTFTGLVLDNAARPIEGAVCILEVPGFEGVQARTELDGHFTLAAPAAGPASLQVEGSFATHVGGEGGEDVPLGSFPALTYEVTLVPNAENSLSSPVLLPPLDPQNALVYDGASETVLRVQRIEGLEMVVAAGTTVTLRNGTKVGPGNPGSVRLSLDQVHQDDIPMPMPDGAAPPVAWTLQPRGASFDPPLRVTYPNVSALPPGAIANFLTFNHDTGRFEIFASGRVANDGSSIDSDPGSGISVAGWGGLCPPYPEPETIEKKGCSVKIEGLDPSFAPSVERLNLTYSLNVAAPFAKLEMFQVGELSGPVFVDFSIPRAGMDLKYAQAGVPGWTGVATLGPSAGRYIGPGLYSAMITVANNADFSDGCSKSSSFKVEVHSISLSTEVLPDFNKGNPVAFPRANSGERRAEIRASVKLKKKDQSPVATAVPVEVCWTFTDPDEPNATADESHEYDPPKALGKRNDPTATYWEGHPDSESRSDDGFKLTAISKTITTGADLGTAKIFAKHSGVGGDDFVLKAAVKYQGKTVAEQESVTIYMVRSIEFANIYEMGGLTHVSRNATTEKIRPYFSGTDIFYDVGERIVIPPALSVKYIGLFKDAATRQLSWEEQRAKQERSWTLQYGPFAGSSGTTEVPTLQERGDAEYAGNDLQLLIARDIARGEITKKAQAWATGSMRGSSPPPTSGRTPLLSHRGHWSPSSTFIPSTPSQRGKGLPTSGPTGCR